MTHVYQIEYELDNKLEIKPYEAPNPGEAFAKCLKEHPSATLIKATRFGKIPAGPMSSYVEINYIPPPVQRPLAENLKPVTVKSQPAKDEMVFPFFDSCCKKTHQ